MPMAESPLRSWQWGVENPTEHIPAVIARSDVHIFFYVINHKHQMEENKYV